MKNDKKINTIPNKLLPFLWHFLKKYKFFTSLLFVGQTFEIIGTIVSSYVMKLIIDGVILNTGSFKELLSILQIPICIFLLTPLVIGFSWRISHYGWIKIVVLRQDIITSIVKYVQKHSYKYFQDNLSGKIANKISDLYYVIDGIMERFINAFYGPVLCLVIGSITIYSVHPTFTLILIVWAVTFFILSVVLSKKARELSKIDSEARSELQGKIVDSVSNIVATKSFARSSYEIGYLNKFINDFIKKTIKLNWFKFRDYIWKDFFIFILFIFLILELIYLKSIGSVTPGDFAFVLGLSISIMERIWFLSYNYTRLLGDIGIFNQAIALIVKGHDVEDKEDAKSLVIKKPSVKFNNVTFGYGYTKKIFKNLDLEIKPNTKVGLVGYSGAGKTTFANLILRYFDIDKDSRIKNESKKGKILIDNIDIRDVTQESLRENIALIPQDPSLFHRTIMENIQYGKIDATKEQVIKASKKANCHEFIKQLEKGYDSLVGERGVKLSGGQRQRIAIARAVLKDAPILILDEATSSLDSVTEKFIQESMKTLMQNRTVIAIAHRLSTLQNMDRILVFEKGKIIEDGTHRQLLLRKGQYAKLWKMQSDGFIVEDNK